MPPMFLTHKYLIALFLPSFPPSFLFFFCLFRAESVAHGSFQARCQIGASATGLYHNPNSAHLSRICNLHCSAQQYPILNPLTEQGQGSKLHPHGYESGSFPLCYHRNSKLLNLIQSIVQLSLPLSLSSGFNTSDLKFKFRSSCHGSAETNPTSIHEDEGLIPGLD